MRRWRKGQQQLTSGGWTSHTLLQTMFSPFEEALIERLCLSARVILDGDINTLFEVVLTAIFVQWESGGTSICQQMCDTTTMKLHLDAIIYGG